MAKVECQPQAACALFEVCKKLVEVDPNRPQDSEVDVALGNEFEAVVDSPEKSPQVLGNQYDTGCLPFNHGLRKSSLGEGTNLEYTIYLALLSRALSTDQKTKASAAGWYRAYTGRKLPNNPKG